ncbi:MAG: hypothetical protein ASARMPRED_005263 [Alectoria sarmentosa]|nr:MAG: hypothetical protein ASARMPRED_005263 [Alectoria sarmentosa]
MSPRKIRFLTSAEKMSSLGKHSRDDERMEGDPNAFVSVLINGNCFQFLDKFVCHDYNGGKEAATALTHAIGEWLLRWDYEVMPLTVRILGNPEWLSDAYYDANIIPNRVNFGWFLQGFNSVESLVEFVPTEDEISVPAYRGRSLADTLKVNLSDPHCKLILYGSVIDDSVTKVLKDNKPATEKLMLFKNSRGAQSLTRLLPNLQQCSFQGLFRDTEHRPHVARPKPVIFRNACGQRVDPPIRPMESVISWLRHRKYCNYHYLRGECPDYRCTARHDGRLDAEQLNGLRYLARGLPCRQSNACRDPICYAGHHCPVPTCHQTNCKFYADMHLTDLRIVAEEEG